MTTSEPEGRGAVWTEERGSLRPSDEGRRRLKAPPEASGKMSTAWTASPSELLLRAATKAAGPRAASPGAGSP